MSEKIYTIEEIKEMLKEILKDQPVYQVILFGSYAKKQATKNSDVDLLIDTKSKLRGFALLKLICKIQDITYQLFTENASLSYQNRSS